MLQLAVVAQLSLVADFLDLKNDQSLILNDDNDEIENRKQYCYSD